MAAKPRFDVPDLVVGIIVLLLEKAARQRAVSVPVHNADRG
jgi:hypothetical protein